MADITLNLKLEGFAEFSRALRKLPGEISAEILEMALVAGAAVVREVAAAKAPRPGIRRRPRTGRLADSIRIFPGEKDRAHAVVSVGTKVPYAHLVEFGHQIVARGPSRTGLEGGHREDTLATVFRRVSQRRQLLARRAAGAGSFVAARPFLRPAFDEQKEQVIQRIGQVLGREIESAFRRLAPKARVA